MAKPVICKMKQWFVVSIDRQFLLAPTRLGLSFDRNSQGFVYIYPQETKQITQSKTTNLILRTISLYLCSCSLEKQQRSVCWNKQLRSHDDPSNLDCSLVNALFPLSRTRVLPLSRESKTWQFICSQYVNLKGPTRRPFMLGPTTCHGHGLAYAYAIHRWSAGIDDDSWLHYLHMLIATLDSCVLYFVWYLLGLQDCRLEELKLLFVKVGATTCWLS